MDTNQHEFLKGSYYAVTDAFICDSYPVVSIGG